MNLNLSWELNIQDVEQSIETLESSWGYSNSWSWISTEIIFVWLVISTFGFIYYRYWKNNKNLMATFCGIWLMVFPYFVYNLTYIIIIAIILCILPFILK
jgi:hypothetical protein